jgi:hypothetical protein
MAAKRRKSHRAAEPQPNFPRGEGRGMNGRGMRFEVSMFRSFAVHFRAHFRSAGFAAAALPDPAPFRQIFAPSEDSEVMHCKRKSFAGNRSAAFRINTVSRAPKPLKRLKRIATAGTGRKPWLTKTNSLRRAHWWFANELNFDFPPRIFAHLDFDPCAQRPAGIGGNMLTGPVSSGPIAVLLLVLAGEAHDLQWAYEFVIL